jgi:cell division protein ZapA
MDGKNEVHIQIFGTTYTIRGEADQEYIQRVAAYVDQKMREINDKLPVASLGKVAVLASLTLADELFQERAERKRLEESVTERADRLSNALDACLQDA